MTQKRTTSLRTIPLDLEVKEEAVINGIEMGVLDNGIPYLTQSGLASVCAISRAWYFPKRKNDLHWNISFK